MIVTLCGSVRFETEFIEAQRELSRRGVICFSLAVLPTHRKEDEGWAEGQLDKTVADLGYFMKIAASDAIIVLGDGYIGQSTAREILWAEMNSKNIIAHHSDDWEETVNILRGRAVVTGRSIRRERLLQSAREVFSG